MIVESRERGIHIEDQYIVDDLVDMLRYQPVARMGYRDYTTVDSS